MFTILISPGIGNFYAKPYTEIRSFLKTKKAPARGRGCGFCKKSIFYSMGSMTKWRRVSAVDGKPPGFGM